MFFASQVCIQVMLPAFSPRVKGDGEKRWRRQQANKKYSKQVGEAESGRGGRSDESVREAGEGMTQNTEAESARQGFRDVCFVCNPHVHYHNNLQYR